MTSYSFLRVDGRGPVVSIMLHRPDVHNAFNDGLIIELTAAMQSLAHDERVRVIILCGAGRSFCAGVDLDWMQQTAGYSYEQNLIEARAMGEMFRIITECPKPVVARVHGSAFGGGVGLVAACDIALAIESAEFAFSEVRMGIVPAIVSPFVLARVGTTAARRYFLTAERFSAQEARRIGLISQVVPDEAALAAALEERIGQLLNGGPQALALCKQLIDRMSGCEWDAAIAYAAEMFAAARVSAEGRRGVAAFLEKRPAPWRRA